MMVSSYTPSSLAREAGLARIRTGEPAQHGPALPTLEDFDRLNRRELAELGQAGAALYLPLARQALEAL